MSFMREFESFVGKHQATFGDQDRDKQEFITTLGLAGEVGEVLELLKKEMRDGVSRNETNSKILLEFGDVLHYLTIKIHERGMTLTQVADANMDKLRKRHGKEMDYEYQSK